MRRTTSSQVDLAKVFGAVTEVLKENQQSLNAADEYNHNHGDNMVESFQTITKAVKTKRKAPPAEQLAAARDRLRKQAQSGSAQLYSQGLEQAAERLMGKVEIKQEDALLLVQALMGGQKPQASQPQNANEDPLGSLLGALAGGQPAPAAQEQGKPNNNEMMVDMLVSAGTAFLQARRQGAEPGAALVQALMAGSQLQSSSHRQQSGQLVAQTLLNTLGSMLSRR